jgi:hypothetical protein
MWKKGYFCNLFVSVVKASNSLLYFDGMMAVEAKKSLENSQQK